MSCPRQKLQVLIAEAKTGFASGERDPHGVVQLRMNNVGRNGEFVWDAVLRVPAEPQDARVYALEPGDVLFNNTNSTELVGKSALFTGHTETVLFSNHFTRLRTHRDVLEPGYLARWLNLQWRNNVFAELCNRWVGQSAVKLDALLPLEIPLPPLQRQRQIVTTLEAQLSAAARARAAVAARLEETDRVVQRWIDNLFAGLARNGVPHTRLETAAQIQAGITLGKDYPQSETVSVPYLRVANVKDGHLDLTDVKSIAVPPSVADRLALQNGDLLLTEGGDPDKVGRGTLWQDELPRCIHQNHIFRLRFDSARFLPAFLALLFRSAYAKAYFLAHAKQTTGIASINQQVIRAFPLIDISLPEQRSAVSRYENLNRNSNHALAALRGQLADLDHLPAALLRDAFGG